MRYIKNLVAAGFMLAVAIAVSAQSPRKLDYGFNFAGQVKVMDTDASGNTYVAGLFNNSESFGTFDLVSNGFTDVYVLKVDPTGTIIGAVSFGSPDNSTDVNGIDVDDGGNVHLVGPFSGGVDFDPGAGDHSITPVGDADGYILKLDSDLGFVWAGSIGGDGYDAINGVAVNSSQEVYLTGEFYFEADLDPEGTTLLFDQVGTSAFFLKLDDTGALQWAKSITNDDVVSGTTVTTDFTGAPIFAGYYFQTVDVNPDGGTETLTGHSGSDRDLFILKLNAAGTYAWGKSIGGDGGTNYTRSITSDGQNNIYVTGFFYGLGDFDPDPVGETLLNSLGDADIFITKFNSAGNLLWAHSLGGGSFDEGADIIANSTDVYITGRFFDEVNFDPNGSHFMFGYEGSTDVFVLNLDASGNFKWVGQLGGDSDDYGYEISTDGAGNLYTTGVIYSVSTNDMDPSCNALYLDAETEQNFLIKLSAANADCLTITQQPVGADVCPGTQVVLEVKSATTGVSYQWMIMDSDGGYGDVIDAAGVYSGAQTSKLTITTNSSYQGEGAYICVLSKSGFADIQSDEAYVTVGPHTPYVVDPDYVNCGPSSASIKVYNGAPGQYRWYTVETGGTPIAGVTNDTYTTPVLPVTTSYYVSINNGLCESDRRKITVWITACEPQPGLKWAKGFGGTATDGAGEMILLKDGNILIPGAFIGSIDVDPGPGVTTLTAADGAQDGFLLKITPDAELIWVKQFIGNTSSPSASFVKEDPDGNIYMAGTVTGNNTDFDPGAGVININGQNTANNFPDAFIMKYDKDGNAIWGKKIHNDAYFDGISGLELDANAVYLSGYFWNTLEIDNVPQITSAGGTDFYVMKLTPAGGVTWLKQFGNTYADGNVQTDINSVLYLHGSDLYVGGAVRNAPLDVDPNAGVHEISPTLGSDAYVLKLNTDGEFQSVFKYENTAAGSTNIQDIIVDGSGTIYTSGSFVGTTDFDPTSGVFAITSTGGISGDPALNGYINKHTAAGGLIWSKALHVSFLNDAHGGDMTIASNGDLIISGYYQGSVDFDPGPLEYILSGNSLFLNSFLLKLNSNGEFNWVNNLARIANVSSSASGYGHFVDAKGDIYMQGSLSGSVDFDPLDCKYEVKAVGATDFYLWKLSFNSANICFNTMPADKSLCAGSEITLTAIAVGAPGITYQWQRSDTETGTYQDLGEGNGYSGTKLSDLKINTAGGFGDGFYRAIASAPNAADKTSTVAEVAFLGTTPDAPATTSAATCNSEGDFTLVATGSPTGDYQWYDLPTGGSSYGITGDSFETGLITSSVTVYVASVDGVCESPRTPAAATVNAGDTPPTMINATRCGPGTVTLTAIGAGDGEYLWYTTASGGSPISGQTNGSFTTPQLTSTTSYYASIALADCESPRAEAVATIGSLVAPAVNNAAVCLNASANITATVSSGEVRWYPAASGGSPIYIGATYATPVLTVNTTYYVSNFVDDCESERVAVTVTVSDCANNQPPVIAAGTATTSVGGTVTLDLGPLLSDPDNNLDLTTLKIISQPTSGAVATIVDGQLVIDYTGSSFAGEDEVTIEVCDIAGSCVQQVIRITVASDIVVYNAVSPNGDGKNDVFFVAFIDAFEATRNNRMKIYNRWGDMVFEVSDYNNTTNAFAGKNNNGNDLPSGTYFYRIEFVNGRKTETGYLSLKR